MNILRKTLVLVVPVMFLAGCATAPTDTMDEGLGTDSSVESSTGSSTGSSAGGGFSGGGSGSGSSAETMGLTESSDISSASFSLDDSSPSNLLNTRVIYFDFDRSKVRAEFNDVIAAHAEYLANNSGAQMKLEGHADERGSREYNIGLGERRGNSIARHLGLQGASRGQLDVVSYGEERPAATGHDEASWELNRRVEIIYTREQ